MLDGYKTYLAGLAAVLTALGYTINLWVTTGDIDVQALVSAFIAMALIFLRQGIKKEG
jgi:hypothetical protein